MRRISQHAEKAQYIYTHCPSAEIAQFSLEDDMVDGRNIEIKGRKLTNFGNSSYLGLDTDERLKIAAIGAISRFGVQFSSSRSFVSVPLYDELEELLERMYGRPAIVAASTSLAHISAIPVFMNAGDVALIDYHAHASLWMALQAVRGAGVKVQPYPHNDLQALDEMIGQLRDKHDTVWIVTDGIFSMFGDSSRAKDLTAILDKYENAYLYIDDAHGMSWAGRNGTGHVMNQMGFHEKMMLAISLNKGFGAGGGALILPNNDIKTVLRRAGPSLVYSGPVQPSALAAGIESAKIHLSPELAARQRKLKRNINHFIKTARDLEVRLADWSQTPIFFLHIGETLPAGHLVWQLRDAGFFTNPGLYPAVGFKESGVRVSLTWHHSTEDITRLLAAVQRLVPEVLREFSAEKLPRAEAV